MLLKFALPISRRRFMASCGYGLLAGLSLNPFQKMLWAGRSVLDRSIKVTKMEVFTVHVTERTKWIIVRLTASNGLTGLGEASLGRQADLPELKAFFKLIEGESPFDIQKYRERSWSQVQSEHRRSAAAFSSIEQALWDIIGKTLDIPVYQLLGGKLRDSIQVYANINRATKHRTPEGFAENAASAVADGFKAVKAAPFDGFPPLSSSPNEIKRAIDHSLACIFAMREAVGEATAIKIDIHSHLNVELAIEVAKALEEANLSWIEEPVNPEEIQKTKVIHDAIKQPLAGGEFLLGMQGFGSLCTSRAVDIIMPDIKYCGGLLEALKISALAEYEGISVAPHNPSGPVSTRASMALCAVLPNFSILEYQWGEADWRGQLIDPPEIFSHGQLPVESRAGFGLILNERVLGDHI